MAKRRGRPKGSSKAITYDSKETKFILGVMFFGLAVFSFMSYILTEGSSLFTFIRSLFGDATFVLSLFSLSASLYFFGLNFFLSTRKSIVAQALFTVLLAAFISTTSNEAIQVSGSMGQNTQLGGIIGYTIANFSLNYLLLNLTAPVIFVVLVLLLPPIFN